MSETIFQRVRGINELAGNQLATHISDLLKQGKIIQAELYEFLQGIADGDVTEMRDGQGDILFTAMGLPGRSGFPYVADMHLICDNQFQKFDRSAEEAEKTHAKYLAMGVETEWIQQEFDGQIYFVTKSAKDQVLQGKKIGKGKWLKSYRWVDVVYPELAAERTPWLGTELSAKALTSLKAELTIWNWINEHGAEQVCEWLTRTSDPSDDGKLKVAIVTDGNRYYDPNIAALSPELSAKFLSAADAMEKALSDKNYPQSRPLKLDPLDPNPVGTISQAIAHNSDLFGHPLTGVTFHYDSEGE